MVECIDGDARDDSDFWRVGSRTKDGRVSRVASGDHCRQEAMDRLDRSVESQFAKDQCIVEDCLFGGGFVWLRVEHAQDRHRHREIKACAVFFEVRG